MSGPGNPGGGSFTEQGKYRWTERCGIKVGYLCKSGDFPEFEDDGVEQVG